MSLYLYDGDGDLSKAYFPGSVDQAMAHLDQIVSEVAEEQGFITVLTGGIEGRHKRGSLHLIGAARDYDFPGCEDTQGLAIAAAVSGRAGPHYDMLWESGERNHLHGEFQPKQGPNQGA